MNARVAESAHGFPFRSSRGSGWIRARDLWPLATPAQQAAIEELCSRYQHYTGEASDTLSGIWEALRWPIPEHTFTERW